MVAKGSLKASKMPIWKLDLDKKQLNYFAEHGAQHDRYLNASCIFGGQYGLEMYR